MSNYEILKKVYKEFSIDLKNAKPSEMEAYPWEDCLADQIARYGDEETAKKVCGAIKAAMKKSFAEGDSLEGSCWEGYEPIGLKEKDGRMVPNCVPVQQQSKQEFVIPSPEGGEDESAFISRCNSAIYDEFPDDAQRNAVCYQKWNEK